MNDSPSFYYRMKPDMTIKIICAICGRSISTTDDEFYLRDIENGHHCAQAQPDRAL